MIRLDRVLLSNSTCKLFQISVFFKNVHPRTCKLSPSKIAFQTPGVREPLVGNRYSMGRKSSEEKWAAFLHWRWDCVSWYETRAFSEWDKLIISGKRLLVAFRGDLSRRTPVLPNLGFCGFFFWWSGIFKISLHRVIKIGQWLIKLHFSSRLSPSCFIKVP